MFQKGDRIEVTGEHLDAGKQGRFRWYSRLNIPGRECRVELDPIGRQKTERTLHLDAKFLTMATKSTERPEKETKKVSSYGKGEYVLVTSQEHARFDHIGIVRSSTRGGVHSIAFQGIYGRWEEEKVSSAALQHMDFSTGARVKCLSIIDDAGNPRIGVVGPHQEQEGWAWITWEYNGKGNSINLLRCRPVPAVGAEEGPVGMPAVIAENATTVAESAPEPFKSEVNFQVLPLSSIDPDPNQPRRHFHIAELQELTDSVREKGVLQSIIVRQNRIGPGYMIVVGERRYHASKAAGLKVIPAIIRELTDEQVLDIQITENLQRKDVHPMEEAIAIKALMDHGKTLEEVVAKLGKSTAYVAGRLKLKDLIPEFQEAYLKDLMDHSEARLICAARVDQQRQLFAAHAAYVKPTVAPDPIDAPGSGSVKGGIAQLLEGMDDDDVDEDDDVYDEDEDDQVSVPDGELRTDGLKKFQFGYLKVWANEQQRKLDAAKFPTEDADLYPEMGACGTCQFNSSNTLLLFLEEGGRVCNNGVCYGIKTQRAYEAKLRELSTQPGMLFVAGCHYGGAEKAKVDAAKALGLIVLKDREWAGVYNDSQLAESQKAFMVVGHKEGQIIDVIVRSNAAAKANSEAGSSQKVKIAEIKQRESRAQELDREKIYAQVMPLIKEHAAYLDSTAPLSREETAALARFIIEKGGYKISGEFRKQFKYKNDGDLQQLITEQLLPGTMNQFIRRAILDSLLGQASDFERSGNAAAVMGIARQYIPDQVKEIELKQQEIAIKRKARVEERIQELKKTEKS